MPFGYRIKAHPTLYRGTMFRSRLEARWAAFFDLVGWQWFYEPVDLVGWTPDFLLKLPCRCGHHDLLVEVKPVDTIEALEVCHAVGDAADLGLGGAVASDVRQPPARDELVQGSWRWRRPRDRNHLYRRRAQRPPLDRSRQPYPLARHKEERVTTAPMWRLASSRAVEPAPNTAFAHAFIVAVYDWAARHSGIGRRMVVPSGVVDGEELKQVILALACARTEREGEDRNA